MYFWPFFSILQRCLKFSHLPCPFYINVLRIFLRSSSPLRHKSDHEQSEIFPTFLEYGRLFRYMVPSDTDC